MLLSKLQACRVEEEVVKPQYEHARLPVVALDGPADNDDLPERVIDLVERALLLGELLGIGDVVGGLQVDALAAPVAHEVDLLLPAPGLPIPVTPIYLHHAPIHHIATAAQLVIYDGMLPNVPHSRGVSDAFPPPARAWGRHRCRVPRGGPAWKRAAASAGGVRREAVTRAPASGTDRPRAPAPCHAWGPVYTQPAPRLPQTAAILADGAKRAPLTGCPRGFSQLAENGHPSGRTFRAVREYAPFHAGALAPTTPT